MGIQFAAIPRERLAANDLNGADEGGAHDDDSGPVPGAARERVLERLTLILDRRWDQIERLEGTEDDAQLERWLLNAVAYDAHEAAQEISQTHVRRLPPFRRRDR